MSEILLIHYNIERAQQATWALCNDAGELTGKITSGTLDELSEAATNHHAVILLNSQCLHINQLQLPTQNMQKMLKAVPYAVEEFIADDIENFHFVISKRKQGNLTSVVGINKITLQNIIQVFQDANIIIQQIIPDALCLAASTNDKQWVCLNYHDVSYLQTDTLNGMVFPHEVLPYVVSSKLQDESQNLAEKILLFSEQENTTAFDQLEINSKSDNENKNKNKYDNIEIINIVYNSHPLVVFCGHYKQAIALNLLQHEFKPRRKSSAYWRHWKLAASMAAIWLVLNLGLASFQHAKVKDENKTTKAEIEKIYKKAFPKSRKIVNPRVQMEQKLNELKSGTGNSNKGLIFLLSESFGKLSADKKNITLQSLTFRNNRIDIGIDGSNLQAIENLNAKLNNNIKIKSEITSSSSEKDKVKGNLRIEGRS